LINELDKQDNSIIDVEMPFFVRYKKRKMRIKSSSFVGLDEMLFVCELLKVDDIDYGKGFVRCCVLW